MALVIHYDDVGYVAHPQLVRGRRNEVLYQVGIGRKPVRGVRSARLAYFQPDLEAVLVDDAAEAVAAYRYVFSQIYAASSFERENVLSPKMFLYMNSDFMSNMNSPRGSR